MTSMHFEQIVDGTPAEIFAVVADFEQYDRWLPGSLSFGGTTHIEPLPVTLGTTYIDAGKLGVRRGTVTEFEPPSRLAFRQPMHEERGPMRGTIDVRVRYAFEAAGSATRVTRDIEVDMRIEGPMRIMSPVIVTMFHRLRDSPLRATAVAPRRRFGRGCRR